MSSARVGRLRDQLGKIGFGGDYNPEQWPAEVWADDRRLMRVAGVDFVTVGVFSWAMVESSPGEYDFSVFDRVMDFLAEDGVAVSLATMTASPPPWLSATYPQTLPRRADGTVWWHGARQAYCPSSPVYREHALRLVDQVATRYGDHPALGLWHVNNEYGVHTAECFCDESAADFRRWLEERYDTIDGLNDAWSTAFWSQRYGSWSELMPPREAPTFCNPAQQLDFARFSSDAMLECARLEVEVLRAHTPDVPVTTNFCGLWKPVDFFGWARHFDVLSIDSYPDPADPASHIEAAFSYDVLRGAKHGQPWLLMEQAPAAVNWRARNATKPPGKMRVGSWQAVARGADAVMYFQWRQSRGGAEKWHSGMVPHVGDDSRTFREVAALGAELRDHPGLLGGAVPADVAIVMDWASWWALELDSHPSSALTMREGLLRHYGPLLEAGLVCDVVPPGADLSAYRLVVVPHLYIVSEETGAAFDAYVRGGGHLLVSYFSALVDECDRVHLGGYLGPLRDTLGIRVVEHAPLQEGEIIRVDLGGVGPDCHADTWSELIELREAQAVALHASGILDGTPAVTRHRRGDGVAWYIGVGLDETGMRAVLGAAASEAGAIPVVGDLPVGVEAVRRTTGSGADSAEGGDSTSLTTILLNHTAERKRIASLGVDLAPYEVRVDDTLGPSDPTSGERTA